MAARQGGVPFGNTLRLREEARDAWGWTWIDRLTQDLSYALRMLRKSPGFSFVAVLMLAVGIGVNVTAFGFFNLMVLRPLPIRNPETILQFERVSPGNFADNFPYPEVALFREQSKTLSSVLAMSFATLTLSGNEKPVYAHFVTANFLTEQGAGARIGRTLTALRDEAPNADPVVFLGYQFWQQRFGGDPSVAGTSVLLNGRPATIIGVADQEFGGLGGQPDVWAPINQEPYFVTGTSTTDFSQTAINVQMWGRLAPGLSPMAAEGELASLAAELRKQHPDDIWEKESVPSSPGGYLLRVRHEMYPVLAIAAALGMLILLVACGNLGSLMLARSVAREREIAIRVAVGASRSRLIRQLFTESLLLAFLGSVASLMLGYVVLRCLILQGDMPWWIHPAPDWRVILFAACIGFASAILFGLAPALQGARQRQQATLMRRALIGAQVAGSCVLLIVSGLLVRALNHAAFSAPGFEYANVITIDPSLRGYTPARARQFFDALEPRLRALPGVESVALASNPPLGHRWTVDNTEIAGRPVNIHFNHIEPSFFETMKIPILRGRGLARGNEKEIVISESLARLRWLGEDPIGKLFRTGVDPQGVPRESTVVGIVRAARLVSPGDSDAVEAYQLAAGDILPSMVVLVRTAARPEALVPVVASVAKAIDPKLFPGVELMKISYRDKVQQAGYTAMAAGILGFAALLLACAGILGLVAYSVSQRTKEIGIRMALGAKPGHVVSAVVRQLILPVGAGLVAGIGAAAAISRLLRGALWGISNLDTISYLAAICVFVLAAAVAAVLPARRALRVDPMNALRED
jgi:predicted permease